MCEEKRTTYPAALKEKAVWLYLEDRSSYRWLCEELGIKDKKTLRQWVAKARKGETLEDGRDKSIGKKRLHMTKSFINNGTK